MTHPHENMIQNKQVIPGWNLRRLKFSHANTPRGFFQLQPPPTVRAPSVGENNILWVRSLWMIWIMTSDLRSLIIMYQKELMKLLWGRIHRFIFMQPDLSEHRSSQWNAPLHWGTKYMWFNKKEILAFALTTSKKNEWQNDDFLHLRTKWNSYFWCTKINKKQTIGYSRKIHTFMTEGMLENLTGEGVNGSGNPEGRGALNLKIHPWG